MADRHLRQTDVPGFDVTTPVNDFLLWVKVSADTFKDGKPMPAAADPHPKLSTHLQCGIVNDSEPGFLRIYYGATRANQGGYNWKHSKLLQNEWPEVEQEWWAKRSDYAANTNVAAVSPGTFGGVHTWTHVGRRQQRTDPITDALFVVYMDVWRDVTLTLEGWDLDAETGEVRAVSTQMVAAGAAGQAVNSSGQYKEVRPINFAWAIRTTRQAAGLASVAGHSRVLPTIVQHTWPAVLDYIYLAAIPGPTDGSVAQIFWTPVYLYEEYSGECEATITETWSLAVPTIDPGLLTPFLPMPIVFRGAMMSISVPACLHPEMVLWEASGEGTDRLGSYRLSWVYAATNYTTWPATKVAKVDVIPMWGGYLKRVVTVNRPEAATTTNRIRLTTTAVGAIDFVLSWLGHTVTGTPNFLVDVSLDPLFTYGFLAGFNGLSVGTATEVTVTGAVIGTPLYCRVRNVATSAVSNTVAVVTRPSPEIEVEESATVLVDGVSTVTFAATDVGSSRVKTFTIRNRGTRTLSGLALTKSGTHQSEYALGALGAVTLDPDETTTFTVTWTAGAAGVRTAYVHIASDDADEASFDIALSGTGHVGEIGVTIGIAPFTVVDGSGTVTFPDSVVGVPLALEFTITNSSGVGTLTVGAITIGGANPAEFVVTTAPGGTVAPGGTTTFWVTWTPGGAGVRSATFSMVNNDSDENPFNFALTGTGRTVDISVSIPVAPFNIVDGSSTAAFGSSAVGVGVPLVFTISNATGDGILTVGAITIGGTNAADFVVTSAPAGTVGPGTTSSFTVTFTPGGAGARSATLSMVTNDTDENPFNFNLGGTGV